MFELLTSAQMRAVEQAAIASGEVTGLELMERAGQGVVEAILAKRPDLASGTRKAMVLCGPGNNGGDGFVIARHLKERGWAVEVLALGGADRLPPDARTMHDRWLGDVVPLGAAQVDPWSSDLIVDAVFGTGLTRPLPEDIGLSSFLPEWDLRDEPGRPYVVAVDIPSGLCADSGKCLAGNALWADLTVTFHRMKPGHLLADGPAQCGAVVVTDIGLPSNALPDDPTRLVERIAAPTKADPFGRATHKFSHGHALILSGPSGRTGAARLAARAALRVGAGLVTIATPHDALAENAAHLSAIMLTEADDPAALAHLLDDKRLNAVALGPGLGQARARDLVPMVLDTARPDPSGGERSVVLDADALSAYASEPTALFERVQPQTVLTPHAGEFARLFPDLAERLNAPAITGPAYSKLDAARDAAARAGCTVLFKGPDTVVADQSGRSVLHAAVYDRAAPWLATAGAGDVLAGLITGLMARGFAPFDAATTAAWLHVEAARSFGAGLIAEDLPEELPKVLRELGS